MTGPHDPIWALGLMSGTSLDGIDAAAVLTDGETISSFGPKRFTPYSDGERAVLRGGLGKHACDAGLAPVLAVVQDTHADMLQNFPAFGVVGFHGQTLSHDPARFQTFQIGDGAALARTADATVVWDFRTADVASGGEGAPLVPVFHFACARAVGLAEITAIVNIGGVANVTWLDPGCGAAEDDGALLAFDTGPGNALIDDFVAARLGEGMDAGGALAAVGAVDETLVDTVLQRPFFARVPPKSLDRDAFAEILDAVADKTTEDGVATLTALTAACIAAAVQHMPAPPERWLVAGGGRHNATLMAMIAARTNAPVAPVEEVGLDGDMLEAQAFAYLAVRVLRGLPTSLPTTTGARLPVCGGRISRP